LGIRKFTQKEQILRPVKLSACEKPEGKRTEPVKQILYCNYYARWFLFAGTLGQKLILIIITQALLPTYFSCVFIFVGLPKGVMTVS
jgi:hypothetical protein